MNLHSPSPAILVPVIPNPIPVYIDVHSEDIETLQIVRDRARLAELGNGLCRAFVLFLLTPNGPSGLIMDFCFSLCG